MRGKPSTLHRCNSLFSRHSNGREAAAVEDILQAGAALDPDVLDAHAGPSFVLYAALTRDFRCTVHLILNVPFLIFLTVTTQVKTPPASAFQDVFPPLHINRERHICFPREEGNPVSLLW